MMSSDFFKSIAEQLSDGKRHTVRIYGHGASGKSTLAAALLTYLNPEQVNLIETDAYIIDGQLRQLVRPANAPHQKVTASMPVSHELASLTRDIQALQKGMDVLTIDCSPWAPQQVLTGSKPILIVEGMSSAFLDKSLFDLSIACYTNPGTELARRLARDVAHRSRVPEFVLQTHQARRQQYETYYQHLLEEADILVDQSEDGFVVKHVTQPS
ncbi:MULTISPECIES: uridine kinase [unclassified Streptococcus]|uniref:uridine kinase family protein n=1 Tax=unclassified Streptococcus TaxID=2608887 RepID=UPI00359DFB82